MAKSAPDGYTLMLTSNGHTIAGVINKGIPFDPVKDFAGVTVIASVPLVAIVPADLPAKTLKEFIALANASPGKLNFSSAGVASTSFLSAEIFRQGAKINIVHVPYKGVPDATTAVIRGDVQMYFAPIPNASELSAAGKVRAIAINSDKRAPQLPDVPTIAEAAVPDYKYESWFGMMAPAGTPRAILPRSARTSPGAENGGRARKADHVRLDSRAQYAGAIRRDHQERHGTLRQGPQGRGRRRELADTRTKVRWWHLELLDAEGYRNAHLV